MKYQAGTGTDEAMVNYLREEVKMQYGTFKEFAKAANLSESSVNRLLNGKRQTTVEEMARLASVLDCSVWDILSAGRSPEADGRYAARDARERLLLECFRDFSAGEKQACLWLAAKVAGHEAKARRVLGKGTMGLWE